VHQKDDLLATIGVGVSAVQRSTAVMGGVSPFDRGHWGCRSEPSRRFGEKVGSCRLLRTEAAKPTFVVNIPTSLSRMPHLTVAAALTPFALITGWMLIG
jgi:hypothetical protein